MQRDARHHSGLIVVHPEVGGAIEPLRCLDRGARRGVVG
jgi:hypothetical protein